nr:ATP-binding protein [Azospirillum soli]
METALLNLAINARDAMSGPMSKGGRLCIRTENVTLDAAGAAAFGDLAPGDYVRLSVSDTGSGMPEDVRARAFDPFFTTKPVGQGTGLGLSQVYGIVRQCGGDARILSVPGEGTTVEIYLPRHVGTATETPATEVPPEPDHQPVPDLSEDGPPRILLVEDEAIVRFVAVEALRGAGYDVEEAEDATAALAIMEASKPFQLLVTDVGLPGLNGRQLAEMARRLQPRLKVIYVTGYAGIATDAEFEPGTLLLPKPFTPDALVQKVGRTLAENNAAAA